MKYGEVIFKEWKGNQDHKKIIFSLKQWNDYCNQLKIAFMLVMIIWGFLCLSAGYIIRVFAHN